MEIVKSELIPHTQGCEEIREQVLTSIDSEHLGDIQYMVMKTETTDRSFYCCWSGGVVSGDKVALTPVGVAALEALFNINEDENVHVCPLNAENDSLAEAVNDELAALPDGSKICFVGDVAGDISSELQKVFKLVS